MPVLIGLLIWAVVVVISMLVCAFLATRWGRDPFGWLLLSAVMGPIAVIGLIGTRQSDVERPARFQTEQSLAGAPPSVLVAVDGSAAAERVARYVADTTPPNSSVLVLAVLPHESQPRTGEVSSDHDGAVSKMVDGPRTILDAAGMRTRTSVGYGNPAEQILRCASEEGVLTIAIGRRGSGLSRALLGSVSDRVVREAKQPVVVVD
jgi:nucleotide-binding universal stress UspA family protein